MSISLINEQSEPIQNRDAAWLFQASLVLTLTLFECRTRLGI